MYILGIDPGLAQTGWAVLDMSRRCLAHGCIQTTTALSLPQRLSYIQEQITAIITQHKPSSIAIEDVFSGGVNHASTMKVIMVFGVLLAASQPNVYAYQPTKIKSYVVGSGKASKQQMAWAVRNLTDVQIKNQHQLDAVSVALCHIYSQHSLVLHHVTKNQGSNTSC